MTETRDMRHANIDLGDKRLSFTLCAIVTGLFMTNISEGIGHLLGVNAETVSLACKLLILLSLLVCATVILERLNVMMVLTALAFVICVILNFVIFPDNSVFFAKTVSTFLLTILPGMICLMALEDYRPCLRALIVASCIISLINTFVLLIMSDVQFGSGYSMGYANSMILPTNVLIYVLLEKNVSFLKKVGVALLIVLNIVSVMAYGSRGALVAIMAFVLVFGFKMLRKKTDFLIILAIIMTLLLCVIFYRQIFSAVYNLLKQFGFNSRTLYLLSTDIGHDSGRSELWGEVIADISSNPFIAHGINGDYALIGIYSHSFIFELVHSLGILFGGIAIIFVLYLIIRTVFSRSDEYNAVRSVMLFSFFPICLFSLSVWTNMYFWLWLTVCLRGYAIQNKSTTKRI